MRVKLILCREGGLGFINDEYERGISAEMICHAGEIY
jgi:hypothetical protein